jgi:3-dehydroquinate synthase class II
MESQYINSRPFRVNAGAVHAYVQAPGGKTAYLSELKSGAEVLVADAAGRAKTAVVGRCKIETRPMVSAARGLPELSVLAVAPVRSTAMIQSR